MASRSPLAPFWPIYTPGPAWPNAEVSHPFYGRAWCTADFAHDPATLAHVYAAISLRSTAPGAPLVPRAYPFAYRRPDSPAELSRPYGPVGGYAGAVCLLLEHGPYPHHPHAQGPP